MRHYTCPKCFRRYLVGQYNYLCGNEACVNCRDHDHPVKAGGRFSPTPICSACGRELSVRLCPGCGAELPAGVETGQECAISVIGGEQAGKSHYLAVLINQLKNEIGKAFDCTLYAQGGDKTLRHYEQAYYKPLFVEKHCLESTREESLEPLYYSLVFGNRKKGKNTNLTFYDTCGGNFEDARLLEQFNQSIVHSKGLLFLIDPMELPRLREYTGQSGGEEQASHAGDILTRVIHLIRSQSKMGSLSRKIPIPIAVCLTKIDKLEKFLDVSSCLRYPSRLLEPGSFDSIEFHNTSLEVQSMLEGWSDRQLINQITSQFEKYAFFGISALGADPQPSGAVSRPVPLHTADPLLWLLWTNGSLSF
ncbi:hypothetical protein U6B65_10235 [Oscillospiraceae bacterium MB08-C2-2]|nr:hypothetical protein U6B65_10235 [Oscillospiraceae bacterium MB08-C2-2]